MTVTKYNPELWLETLTRGIQTYAEEGFNNSVLDPLNNAVGSEVYDVMMEFPATNEILTKVPLAKTIVHFEIDIIEDIELGFSGNGQTIVQWNYDPGLQQVIPQEGVEHRVNFDVGVWASDRSGGTTARLRAYQNLIRLFQGKLAFDDLREATTRKVSGNFDGALEIFDFTGGRFLSESINDITLYRMVDCNLTIRCFSRTSPLRAPIPTIEEIDQDAELIIDDNLTLP
jgi:hypothetical protein